MEEELESISSYPLQWPHGWKKPGSTQSSRFGRWNKPVSIRVAIDFVIDELRKMGIPSWNIIISSNLKLKNDGYPYSNQREPDDVGISVWWRVDNSRKVIALGKYNKTADNLYAVGKTIEAMRGIERWGSGEILERTFEGFAALPDPNKLDWRTTLGYDGDSLPEAKTLFRKKMIDAHPDRNAGDSTQATVLNEAMKLCKEELA